MTESEIKVLVVDDHSLFRRGVVSALSMEKRVKVVGEASDGQEALKKAEELAPDVILMDIHMPRCSGLEATRALQEKGVQSSILILTISDKEADLFEAIKAGAQGYLLKDASPEELIDAVLHLSQGEAIVSPLMANKLLHEFRSTVTREPARESPQAEGAGMALSGREKEVLPLVAQGKTNKEIAEQLVVAENTVKTHLRNILEKLHLKNRSEAAAYAAKKGLVDKKS